MSEATAAATTQVYKENVDGLHISSFFSKDTTETSDSAIVENVNVVTNFLTSVFQTALKSPTTTAGALDEVTDVDVSGLGSTARSTLAGNSQSVQVFLTSTDKTLTVDVLLACYDDSDVLLFVTDKQRFVCNDAMVSGTEYAYCIRSFDTRGSSKSLPLIIASGGSGDATIKVYCEGI